MPPYAMTDLIMTGFISRIHITVGQMPKQPLGGAGAVRRLRQA